MPKKKKAVERRQYVRVDRVMNIEYKLVKKDGQKKDDTWHLSTTQDMSAGGLSFLSECRYSKGDLLKVRVVMSGVLDIYEGYAVVIHIREKNDRGLYLLGIKFTDKAS